MVMSFRHNRSACDLYQANGQESVTDRHLGLDGSGNLLERLKLLALLAD